MAAPIPRRWVAPVHPTVTARDRSSLAAGRPNSATLLHISISPSTTLNHCCGSCCRVTEHAQGLHVVKGRAVDALAYDRWIGRWSEGRFSTSMEMLIGSGRA
jgi:hypothetical protein